MSILSQVTGIAQPSLSCVRSLAKFQTTASQNLPFTAIVTGGAAGIGRAVAEKLASRKIEVLIADVQAERAKGAAEYLSATFDIDTASIGLDVTQESDVRRMVDTVVARWGRLDYAANCAGICESIWDEEESITTELVTRSFEANQRGLWLCQKFEALQMKSQEPRPIEFNPPSRFAVKPQRGSIANVASVSALSGMGLAAYTPTKHAAIGITRNGARFYGPEGIRCNAICPGMTLTPMLGVSMGETGREGSDESNGNPALARISLRRMAFAQEQANVISFLLSPESSYCNDSHIVVDGGFIKLRY